MLTITFLGHQGWMFGAGGAHILVDPLLCDWFGVRPEGGLRLYPPRHLDVTAAPPISAVYFTHEHDDHFQIASLARIDRRTPILLSSRSSSAAESIARRMGFEVRRLDAGVAVRFGDLELRTLVPDLLQDCGDEWDVLPFAVRDLVEHGSFMSCVDLLPGRCEPRMLAGPDAPTVVALPNNFTSNHSLTSFVPAPAGALPILPQLVQWLADAESSGTTPHTLLLSGGGWSFSGALAGLNRSFFPADSGSLARALEPLLGRKQEDGAPPRLCAPLPGDTLQVKGRTVSGGPPLHPDFVRPLDRSEWPDRRYDRSLPRAPRVEPFLADVPFEDAELPLLQQRLDQLARAMVGGRLFLALNSLSPEELGPQRRAYALFAQTSAAGAGYLFEYAPSTSAFVPATSDVKAYAAGASCWAQDLLAGLGGELSGVMLSMGRLYEWIRCKPRRPGPLTISGALCTHAHPLRMPAQFLALYERLAAAHTEGPRLRAAPGA